MIGSYLELLDNSSLAPGGAAVKAADYLPVSMGSRQFGRYQLLYRFASGGMAQVYLGRLSGEEGFERLVALKVIHEHLSMHPEFVKMFIDEARLVSRITHPNVAMTLDLGRVGNTHFIAMEYVEGESLTALLRRLHLSVRYAARIIADAAAGLHAAHELQGGDGQLLNVVHRDVSPGNILIGYNGTVKMIDFGVARARGSLHTTSGEVKGKFAYMSPEQLGAPHKVDRRTDVFALGVILYETTTWKRLFKSEIEGDTIHNVLHSEIPRPTQVVPDYPEALEAIVMRALDRDLERRYPTAQEMQHELERYIAATGEPVLLADISKMMATTFEDRLEEKKRMLDESAERDLEGSVPDARSASTSSVVLGSVPTLSTAGRRRRAPRRALLVLGLLLLLAGAATAIYFVAKPSPAPGPAKPGPSAGGAAAAVTPSITISAAARPAGATITLDGKSMPNPFEIRRPSGEGEAKLVLSAPGHLTRQIAVPLARGGAWTVELERDAASKKQAAATKDRRPRRPRRHKRGVGRTAKKAPGKATKVGSSGEEEEFLDNPYHR